jgi:serine phosphatase RsbU (regulator of sigma subunit)
MALSKALARSIILREQRLDVATALLNEELSRDGIDSGLTLILGIIDLSTGEVTLVSAGHDDPFRIATEGVVTDIRLDGGPPLCIVDFPGRSSDSGSRRAKRWC